MAVLLLSASSAQAALVTYEFTGVADGNISGVSFSQQQFTFTLTGDTSNIVYVPADNVYQNPVSSVDFVIQNFGSGTLTDPYQMFSANNFSAVGFSHLPDVLDRVTVLDTSLATYNLSTSTGPVSGNIPNPFYNDLPFFVAQFNDDAFGANGTLNLFNATAVSFQAVSAVPEPTSTILLAMYGLVQLPKLVRRRLAKTS